MAFQRPDALGYTADKIELTPYQISSSSNAMATLPPELSEVRAREHDPPVPKSSATPKGTQSRGQYEHIKKPSTVPLDYSPFNPASTPAIGLTTRSPPRVSLIY